MISNTRTSDIFRLRELVWALPVLWLMVTIPVLYVSADEPELERLTIAEGAMKIMDTAFEITAIRVADSDVVRAEKLHGRRFSISGIAAGVTDVHVSGDAVSRVYSVTVIENIKVVLQALHRDLEDVPEVELYISLGRVVVRGEVASFDHWNLLLKVIAAYTPYVVDLSTFSPAPEVILQLRHALVQAGFTVATTKKAAERPGTLWLDAVDDTIYVTGSVYTRDDDARVRQILRSHRWLVVTDGDGERRSKDRTGPVSAVVNLTIVPTILELDVCFIAVTDEEESRIGTDLARAGLITIDTTAVALRGEIRGHRRTDARLEGSYIISSGLAGALPFFKRKGPSRIKSFAHLSFSNGAKDWQTIHSGGTLKIRVASDNAVDLKDIDYGLMVRLRGGLHDQHTAALQLNLELSLPIALANGDYDLKRNRIESTIRCPIGKTLVLGGVSDLVEGASKEGVPFLKSIPILSWLFSEKNHSVKNRKLLILISPQIAPAPTRSSPLSRHSDEILKEAERPVKERLR